MGRVDVLGTDVLLRAEGTWRSAECPWCSTREAFRQDGASPVTLWRCPQCKDFSLTDEARSCLEDWQARDPDAWVRVRERIRELLRRISIDLPIDVVHLEYFTRESS